MIKINTGLQNTIEPPATVKMINHGQMTVTLTIIGPWSIHDTKSCNIHNLHILITILIIFTYTHINDGKMLDIHREKGPKVQWTIDQEAKQYFHNNNIYCTTIQGW